MYVNMFMPLQIGVILSSIMLLMINKLKKIKEKDLEENHKDIKKIESLIYNLSKFYAILVIIYIIIAILRLI